MRRAPPAATRPGLCVPAARTFYPPPPSLPLAPALLSSRPSPSPLTTPPLQHEKAFGEKLQKGLSEKDILGPAKKRPAASRRPRPTPTPAPFFELPTLAWTPELQVGLSVLGLFVVPLVGLLAYCLVTAKSAPKAAARVAEAPAAAAKTVSSAAKRALKAKGQ